MIAETVQPWRQCPNPTGAIGVIVQTGFVAQQQIETVIGGSARCEPVEIAQRRLVALQIVADQMAARGRVRPHAARIAVVGEGGETTRAGDAQPGSAFLEIAARKHLRAVLPERQRRGGAVVKFVPIGRDQQFIIGMGAIGD